MSEAIHYEVATSGNCIRITAPRGTWAEAIQNNLAKIGVDCSVQASTVEIKSNVSLAEVARVASPECVAGTIASTGTLQAPPPGFGSST